MSNNKKVSKEEKMAKGKELMNEVNELELCEEDLDKVAGGIQVVSCTSADGCSSENYGDESSDHCACCTGEKI